MSRDSGKCRVILLNPPTASPATTVLLNLAYLSAVLKDAGHEVLLLDATAPHRPLTESEVERRIRACDPHFIGVTMTITYVVETYAYLQRLKRLGIPIVAGGPHANCLPEETLQHGVDVVAIGEGEKTVLELADHFLGNRPLEQIPGLCLPGSNGAAVYTPKRPLIRDLDTIPFPDHQAFPIANYTGSSDPDSNPVFWNVFTSRGCPYNCTFCSSHNVFGRTYRARTPENVMAEITGLARTFGTRFIAFQDDEAFINEQRIVRFCRLVRERKLPILFSARLRIDSLSEPMLAAMKEAGFRRLSFGVESWNDETLARINKKYTVETVKESFRLIARTGFPTVAFANLVGFPWETEAHLRSNLAEIATIPRGLVYYSFVVTPVPYPGTKLYEDYHEEYGFTEWWLDPKRNSRAPVDDRSFFMAYARGMQPLYSDDPFWNYSKGMKKAITSYCWSILSGYLKRCMSFPEYLFVYYLCRASHRLWKISPRLERILLRPFKALARTWGLPEKASYVHRR